MPTPALPFLADVVPGLRGRGVLFADPGDFRDIALTLMSADYSVCEIDGRDIVQRRQALPALAQALRLPGAADHNLDALLDTLRDLPELWPSVRRLVLLWQAAEQFVEGDPHAWAKVRAVLQDATTELHAAGFAFETVAFLAGYDVPPLLLGVPRRGGPRP